MTDSLWYSLQERDADDLRMELAVMADDELSSEGTWIYASASMPVGWHYVLLSYIKLALGNLHFLALGRTSIGLMEL